MAIPELLVETTQTVQDPIEVELAALQEISANHAELLKFQLLAMGTIAVAAAIESAAKDSDQY